MSPRPPRAGAEALRAPRARTALFAATIAVNAALLFAVEPLVSRQLLPLLGGTPSVWNTCVMAFQALLLAGYVYAHVLTRRLGVRAQGAVHLGLLALSWLTLPVLVPRVAPPAGWPPAAWLVGLLLAAVGAPFMLLAAGAPLLQRWFAAGDGGPAPYALYAASNAGSLLALLAYPLLVEPRLGLAAQGRAWSAAYAALALLLGACAVAAARPAGRPHGAPPNARAPNALAPNALAPNAEPPGADARHAERPHAPAAAARGGAADAAPALTARARWTFLAFVPSALLLGVTRYLTTDVAPVPLLWVGPLAVYLLTFVLAFADPLRAPDDLRDAAFAITTPVLAVLVALGANSPLAVVALAHLVGFGVAVLACHQSLADRRPGVTHLTGYYLWIAAGGLLGGLFDALVAPAVFDTLAEYPIEVALAAVAWWLGPVRPALVVTTARALGGTEVRYAPGTGRPVAARLRARLGERLDAPPEPTGAAAARRARGRAAIVLVRRAAVPLAAGALTYVSAARLPVAPGAREVVPSALFGLVAAALAWVVRGHRPTFALTVAAVLAGGTAGQRARAMHVLIRARSFYGAYTVRATDGYHHLQHGNTLHGAQDTRPGRRTTPLTYYHAAGPLGALFARVPRLAAGAPPRRVAVVGLGAGTLACWGRAGERWTFYEVDPLIARLARDPRLFTYLRDCPPHAGIVLGDARLSLAHAPAGAYDLILLDAFSSDAIPTHLLTREAVALYAAHLAPGGVLALHLSNRYLDLVPVVARLAGDAGLAAAVGRDVSGAAREHPFLSTSVWAALARDSGALGTLTAAPGWHALPARRDGRPWSDDYTNVLAAVRWR